MEFKSGALVLVLILISFLFFGCTQNSICGDSLCSTGEENTCPTDCATQINGTVFVNIIGANDATDLTLEYYSSSNISYNFYNSVVSSLASNLGANSSKNLSISLNQNDSVTKPVPESRQLTLEGLKQGEYFFTARNSDYSYYGKAEKVLINEDKDYYVNIEVKANQPIVKVNAVDESGNLLMGSGKIEIFEVTSYYDPSTQMTKSTENSVGIVEFTQDQYLTGLFNLWPERNEFNYQTHFKAVVTKDNYGSAVYDYLGVQNKYNSVLIKIVKEKPVTGSLTIQIVPGKGTTLDDLEVLKGTKVLIFQNYINSFEKTEIISSSLDLKLDNYPVGSYYIYSTYYGDDHAHIPPITFEYGEIQINEGVNESLELNAYLGVKGNLSVLDSSSNLIPINDIDLKEICYTNTFDNTHSCQYSDVNKYSQVAQSNPLPFRMQINSEKSLNSILGMTYTFSLGYKGQWKDFNFSFKQGWNDIQLKFNSIYTCTGEIDPNALLYAGDDLDLTANTQKVLVSANTNAKCEYYCKEGYYLDLGKCVLGPDDRNARAFWKKAVPFAINDWNRVGDKLYLTIKNVSKTPYYLRGIYLDNSTSSNKYSIPTSFISSQTKIIAINLTTPCTSNGTYQFLKDSIKIRYSLYSTSINLLTQKTPADILGRCN